MDFEGLEWADESSGTHGLMAHNENKKPVLSQLMAVSETWKNSAAVPDTGENVSHYLGISDVGPSVAGGCAWSIGTSFETSIGTSRGRISHPS